ncbi:MAG: hypothetical protein SFV17_10165 [Candidatus Obscuribacter sp.]|nr:hypothetical protein [Candidatus Obscuribacter sp.]
MVPIAGHVPGLPASLGKSGKHLVNFFIAESAARTIEIHFDRKTAIELCLELLHTLLKKQNLPLQPKVDTLFFKQSVWGENFYVLEKYAFCVFVHGKKETCEYRETGACMSAQPSRAKREIINS